MTVVRIGKTTTGLEALRPKSSLDYLELDLFRGAAPKRKALQRCRETAPAELQFGVWVSCPIAGLDSTVSERVREAAEILAARWIVVGSASELRPTAAARTTLAAAFESLSPEPSKLAWQPQGLWSEEQAGQFAQDRGVQLVVDPLDTHASVHPPSAYWRLSPLALRGTVRPAVAQRLAEMLEPMTEAYVVLPLQRAEGPARALRSMLVGAAPES